jgi:drug/metabolite transporter (DMT)-like permease
MTTDRRNLTSSGLLFLAAVIWGFAFVAQRAGMEHVGPFTFNGVRFLLGSMVLLPVVFLGRKRRRERDRCPRGVLLLACGLTGLVLFGAASLQQIGLVYTTAGKAGFITGLYVVIVPLLGLLVKRRAGATVWVGAGTAAAGLYLLSVKGAMGIALGDGLVLAGAFGWAIHVHLVGWLAGQLPPLVVAVSQFTVCGVLSLVVAGVREPIAVDGLLRAAIPIAYAGVLSVGVAYTLQVVGQRHVDPARTGIILSLEGAFAVLGGWLILDETLTARGLAGCGLMLVGMLLSQLRRRKAALVSMGSDSR